MRFNFENVLYALGAIAAGGLLFPYKDPEGAKNTLEKTTELVDIQIKDERNVFGCGKGDIFRTAFVAKNKKGQDVPGIVCRGIFKGSTIRYD